MKLFSTKTKFKLRRKKSPINIYLCFFTFWRLYVSHFGNHCTYECLQSCYFTTEFDPNFVMKSSRLVRCPASYLTTFIDVNIAMFWKSDSDSICITYLHKNIQCWSTFHSSNFDVNENAVCALACPAPLSIDCVMQFPLIEYFGLN